MAQLLETAFSDGSLKENDVTQHDPVNAYIELLSVIPVRPDTTNLDNDPKYSLQGIAFVVLCMVSLLLLCLFNLF